MYVFKDMEDYRARGKNVDTEYSRMLAEMRKPAKKPASSIPTARPTAMKPVDVVPPEIVGKQVIHKSYGKGTITGIAGGIIIVTFNSVGEKKLGYEVCIKNRLIELI